MHLNDEQIFLLVLIAVGFITILVYFLSLLLQSKKVEKESSKSESR